MFNFQQLNDAFDLKALKVVAACDRKLRDYQVRSGEGIKAMSRVAICRDAWLRSLTTSKDLRTRVGARMRLATSKK